MEMSRALVLPVAEPSQIAEARRLATALARHLGLGETETGQVALVVTEAATNMVKHAGSGVLLAQPLRLDGGPGMEILALDRGPGMASVAESLRDGHSTAGSPGTGLGAIVRLSALADIFSAPGAGTAVLARVLPSGAGAPPPGLAFEVGAVCVAKPGEEACGDDWAADQSAQRLRVLVADGLGHGVDAAVAAKQAARVFRERPALDAAAVLEAMHAALRGTRGLGAAVAEVDRAHQVLRFAGVGNVAGVIVSADGARSMVSHHGILGHQVRKIQEFSYPWPAGALLVMHSDGLGSQWSLERYPGLSRRHPSLVAGMLYRDFCRGSDDVTVVVARER